MNALVIKDYLDEVRKGTIIHDVRILPNHYSGIMVSSGRPVFVKVPKQYCETIKPTKHAKRSSRV